MSEQQVFVVTGGSAGLGRAIVDKIAERRGAVAVIARGAARVEAACTAVREAGGRALALPLDVSDASAVEQAAERVEQELGPIDVWINDAMLSVFSPVKEMQADEYRRVTEVTYLGYVNGTLAALKRMLPRDRGTIIQVGSALAHRAIPLQSAYCAAKHAMKGFTESLITELLHDKSNVRVSMVQMPAMNTPQFDWVKSRLKDRGQPVPPIFQPEVGAHAVMYAVDNDVGRELLVAWPTVKAVFGEKFVPSYIDHVLARDGYASQQTDEPEDPNRPNNLWEPVPGDYGAHGRFDARAHDDSAELELRLNRDWLMLAGGVLGGVALASLGKSHRGRKQLRAE
jgi:NAD(P)-dependent dehydrogenase (short-subunit alcohol dehydrogenase family)